MKQPTAINLFAGGGVSAVGIEQAGVKIIASVEYDEKIAEWHRVNFDHPVICAKVEDVDPAGFERPDFLFMSPVCTRASRANVNGVECEIDLSAARACARWITTLTPDFVVLENVWQYRHFESFHVIRRSLEAAGYLIDIQHLDAADFGVPQNRCRMILRACLNQFVPCLPDPTPWRGWYEAIEDLIPGLPETEFAPWQVQRLPEEFRTMLAGVNGEGGNLCRDVECPAPAVAANHGSGKYRAFIIGGGNTNMADPTGLPRYEDFPANTVSGSTLGRDRAYLVSTTDTVRDSTVRDGDDPSFAIRASAMRRPITTPQAYLLNHNISGDEGLTFKTKEGEEPAFTVTGSAEGRARAFVCDGQSNSNGDTMTVRNDHEPMITVSATCDRRPARAYENGKVVRLSARCLARFQSLPDWFQLPENNKLASKIIGNGWPSEMARRITLGLLGERITPWPGHDCER